MKTHTVAGGGGVRLHVVETGNPLGRPMYFSMAPHNVGL